MGYRIHRAIGWGMEWNKFEELTTLDCEAHETSEKLWEVFDKATDADLTVPWSHRSETWRSKPPHRTVILDHRLLALTMDFSGDETEIDENGVERRRRIEGPIARASDLFKMAMDPDNTHAIVFFPNAREAKHWFRYDDMIDYQFEALRDGRDGDPNPRDFIVWPKFGHYPYSNYIMDANTGEPLEWDLFSRLDETYPQGWAPDVPSEIRWYLPKLGLLDEKGVNQLRPIVAQWWC